MNETNVKHSYCLMVRDARGAIWNPVAQISKAGAEFMTPGAQSWVTQGLDFLTMLATGAGPAK